MSLTNQTKWKLLQNWGTNWAGKHKPTLICPSYSDMLLSDSYGVHTTKLNQPSQPPLLAHGSKSLPQKSPWIFLASYLTGFRLKPSSAPSFTSHWSASWMRFLTNSAWELGRPGIASCSFRKTIRYLLSIWQFRACRQAH